jgi:hypothetical protein
VTATIIQLGKPPANRPGPLDDEYARLFMYKFSGELSDLEAAATYSLRDAPWSVVKAMASPYEVHNTIEALRERGWVNPTHVRWDLFLLPHYQWYDTSVWLVVGEHNGLRLGVTRTHLHEIGVKECGRLLRIYAGAQPCWIQGVGFVGPLECEEAGK